MNEEKLSKRLETVASYIPKGAILADIGSDHAYLPCYAFLNGMIQSGIAGEVAEGPLQSAKKQISKNQLDRVLEARKGDGLEVIEPNEVTCITIAGMGGSLIRSILDNGKSKLPGVERLILQPNIGAYTIREWLIEHDWELIAEEILEEDKKIYEVLVAEKGNPQKPYKNKEQELLLGPFLVKEKNPIFIKKWNHELNHWERILEQLSVAGETTENHLRKEELKQKIKIVKEALK
ncbi:tRNA (adenine(22)-N(1))-methyltransferase [Bacillus sp. REN16]|uniref:tRNA (adenine(22)-N(1))-methyltransferase n=1 Tax=Bacillus sp. REN16 TaxID=2887296 RepID=UPI001E48061C|nr:tRNA (adenine(22)-N(1))-methyltransferase TrmK [Bacillus sp. REN16]MCC3356696.1 tRNA (adenine(22)-N(1))-methyltransferase TrmK [Bacillus sp. REN16]